MSKKILAFILTLAMVCSVCLTPVLAEDAQSVTFPDAQGHWAESSIDRWANAGIVAGDQNGNVNPGQFLTRAELATILVRLLGLSDAAAADTFSDVSADAWYADAVLKCAAAGIMQGWAGKAMPEDSITREQAITMVGRALGVKAKAGQNLAQFGDADQVADYAAQYMAPLTAMGILSGVEDGSMVAPKANIDRASALALLDKAIAAYVTAPDSVKVSDANKFVVVNATAGDVTISGTAAGVLVTNGNKANVKLDNLAADTVKVDAPVAVTVTNGSKLGDVDVNAPATVTVDRGCTVGAIDTTDAPAASVNNNAGSTSSGGSSSGGSSTSKTYTITVDAAIVGGTVTANRSSAAKGAVITLTVTPDEGYTVADDAVVVTGVETVTKAAEGKYTFAMPGQNVTVTVTFTKEGDVPAAEEYTITVDAAIVNGTVTTSPADKAAEGATVTVTATPAEGYELESITVNGQAITGATFTMPAAAVTVSATFKATAADEDPLPEGAVRYVLDITEEVTNSKLTVGNLTDAVEALGTDGFFTIIPNSSGKIEDQSLTFSDIGEKANCFKTGGGITVSATQTQKLVAFETTGVSTIKIWWTSASSSGATMTVMNKDGEALYTDTETYKSGVGALVNTITDIPAGQCYVGSAGGGARIYRVEVTFVPAEPEPPVEETTYNVTVDTASDLIAVAIQGAEGATYTVAADTQVTIVVTGATYTVGEDTAVYTIGSDAAGVYVVAGDATYYITADTLTFTVADGKATATVTVSEDMTIDIVVKKKEDANA